jgi:YHS domain-containing protein
MLKQLVITFALISLFGAFALAQENTEMQKKDRQECSKSCCAKKDMHSDMKMDDSKESHSNMHMNESTETATVQIWNKVCPVKGEEVDAEAPTVEYNGKVIGFCCPGCDLKFKKDPEKYMKNLNEDGTEFIGS